ncbi:hypothetical protein FPV13_08780 [Mammaliicoccus sciuri]|uniref:hypothetical protein n=1 Tax=Mammaliicoccus sciuri TaxID=1296 RepID=UPI00118C4EC7|nr:hypothetical protein [Mammaliicoccus sciuri]QDR64970.1 hypothetical protein FPV13_08780 [Mammaliicoccus sciuri]
MKNIMRNPNYTIEDKKKYFIGEVTYTILNYEIFKKNSDLKKYISIYEELMELNEYKEYLYRSRTLLISRILKDIKINIKDSQFEKLVNRHIKFLSTNKNIKNDEKKVNINKSNSDESLLNNYLKAKKGRSNTDVSRH